MNLINTLLQNADLDRDLLQKNLGHGDNPEVFRDVDFILYSKTKEQGHLVCSFVRDNCYRMFKFKIPVAMLLLVVGITACSAGTVRNDLLVEPIGTEWGNLIIQFQDTSGFVSGKRDSANYNILIRLDNIPENAEGVTAPGYEDSGINEGFDKGALGGMTEKTFQLRRK